MSGLIQLLRALADESGYHKEFNVAADRIAELEAENARLKTPAAKWREAGEPDPHGDYYDCERAKLCMGHLTDDELANEVFMKGGIGELTAAKERIRWLSRLVVRLQDHSSTTLGGPTTAADAAPAYGSNQELTDILKLLDAAPSLPLDSCKPEELQAWTTAIKSVLVHIGAALK